MMQLVRRHFVGGGFVCLLCEGNVTDMHLLSTLYFKTSLVITVAVAVFPMGFVINANRYAIHTYIHMYTQRSYCLTNFDCDISKQ